MHREIFVKSSIYGRVGHKKETAKVFSQIDYPHDVRFDIEDCDCDPADYLAAEEFIRILLERNLYLTKNYYIVTSTAKAVAYLDGYNPEADQAFVLIMDYKKFYGKRTNV